MKGAVHLQFLMFLVWLLCLRATIAYNANSSVTEVKSKCIEREKQALLQLKGRLVDDFNKLSSWGSKEEDCCKWEGVSCNETTGHVDGLAISWSGGEINSSLLELQYLTGLVLFGFNGTINPYYQIGNLSRLSFLRITGYSVANIESLMWLSHLPALEYLDMSQTNLSRATDWLQAINSLPSLQFLYLKGCGLISVAIPPLPSRANSSTALLEVDLSENNLSIFPWLFNFNNSLVYLDLARNQLQGPIPEALGEVTSLRNLDLSQNFLEGDIPRTLGNLCNLTTLYLSENNLIGELPNVKNFSSLTDLRLNNNNLNGSLTESVGLLLGLVFMDISSNFMSGIISDIHFLKLNNLRLLDISSNSFLLNFSSSWVPPFQLEVLIASHCTLGPRFPQWLQTQEKIISLELSNAGITDWFWELPFKLTYFNLSHNGINGEAQKLSSIIDDYSRVDLSFNNLHGSIPLLGNVSQLNLSNNKFSGNISNLCSLAGENLLYIDLSSNLLSGQLPDCLTHWIELRVLSLANNNFSGSIPASFGSLLSVETLNLRNNSLSKKVPDSLGSCRELKVIDLGENRLSGNIPTWIGSNLSSLIVLRLKSNRFFGTIPLHLCQLASIQILDLSYNNISGNIPQCFNNFTALTVKGSALATISHEVIEPDLQSVPFVDRVLLIWKGLDLEFGKTLGLVKSIDLSSNNLNGEIPSGITSLLGLVALNLSHNELIGIIPSKIGLLKSLEALDLSANRLNGGLPQGLSELSFLNYLNLSYNNFWGKIPLGTQLQSFNKSSFMGNTGLCGKPLSNACPGEQTHSPSNNPSGTKIVDIQEDKDGLVTPGFFLSMGLGFATGFWGVCGTLLLKNSWRHAYFRFLNNVGCWMYVTTALIIAKLQRRH